MLNHLSPQMSLIVVIAALGSALLASTELVAQDFSASDTREIASYLLTDAGLAKYTQATKNLGALAQRLSCDADEDEEQSLDQFAARIAATPGASAALQSASMTAREYVVFTFSLIQNALGAWSLSQPGGQLPPGTLMANVTFYRAHEPALQALGEQMQADDCDSGDEDEEAEDEQ